MNRRDLAGPSPRRGLPSGLPRRPRAILFDVYGTLLRERPADRLDTDDRLRALAARYGLRRGPERLAEDFSRAVTREHARLRSAGVEHPEVRVDELWRRLLPIRLRSAARRFALEYERAVNPVEAMPGGLDAVALSATRGLKLGIVSNAQFFTSLVIEELWSVSLTEAGFDPRLVLFSYRFREAKPSGRLFHLASRRLAAMGIAAEQALFIGNDPVNDVRPAAACGFMTALFAGHQAAAEFDDGKANIVLSGWDELPSHL